MTPTPLQLHDGEPVCGSVMVTDVLARLAEATWNMVTNLSDSIADAAGTSTEVIMGAFVLLLVIWVVLR